MDEDDRPPIRPRCEVTILSAALSAETDPDDEWGLSRMQVDQRTRPASGVARSRNRWRSGWDAQLVIARSRFPYMASYEDLGRRALRANADAEALEAESRRVRDFSRILRAARVGRVILCRCAWCDRFKIGDEWLHLDEVGRGGQRIRESLRRRVSHGICPDCFQTQLQLREH